MTSFKQPFEIKLLDSGATVIARGIERERLPKELEKLMRVLHACYKFD